MNERLRQDEDENRDIPLQEVDASTQQNVLADNVIEQEANARVPYKPRQRRILVACCVLIFAKMAAPPLWVLIPPAPPQAFGAHNLAFRLTTSGSTLVFMAFLLIGGVLGDLYGRRRLLLVGSVSFVVANILCIFTNWLPLFITGRLLVGASSALMVPLILAVIRLAFPPRQRIIAIGVYTAVVGIGTALGPLTAQLILQFADWRVTYLLPIACGCVGIVLARRSIQESRVAGGMRRGDAIGTVAWSAVLLSLLFGLLEINVGVFAHIYTTLALLLGVWGLAVLAWLKMRPAGKIFRVRLDRRALAIVILAGCTLNGVFIGSCLELYSFLRSIQGYSVIQIIFAFAPLLPALIVPILISARIAGRVDERTQTSVGFLLLAAGTFALSFIGHQTSYWWLLFPLIVLGMGFSATSSHLTNAFMSIVAPDLAGTAAGTNNAYTQVGNSLGATALAAGILWFGSAAYAAASNSLPPKQLREQLAYMSDLTVRALREGSPSLLPDKLYELGAKYQAAYAQGLGETLLVASVICLAMGALVWFGLRHVTIHPDQEH